MLDANHDDHAFRFLQLRPPRNADGERGPGTIRSSRTTRRPSGRTPDTTGRQRLRSLLDADQALAGFSASADFALLKGYANAGVPMALNSTAFARLPAAVQATLEKEGLDPLRTPIVEVMARLESAIAGLAANLASGWPTTTSVVEDEPEERPYIRTSGIADLLVVKQQIIRYEASEIAHIENVLAKESKRRSHRRLDREEQVFFSAEENTIEKEAELETADRFEINRESTRTIQRDRELGFGLSVSGKYGPTVEFTSNLEASQATSESEAVSSATRYARDVTERTKERIVASVREERTRTIVREVEEINRHVIDNDGDSPIVGTYQFLEKIYESQVFNYGLRQMFDFMIPEPASYLHHLRDREKKSVETPAPPIPLEDDAPNASGITIANYLALGARYGVTGLQGPPPLFLTNRTTLHHGSEGDSEEGQPRSRTSADIDVPAGYKPLWVFANILALTDDDPTVAVMVGETSNTWQPDQAERVAVSGSHEMVTSNLLFFDVGSAPNQQVDSAKLPVHAVVFETKTFVVNFKVVHQRLTEHYRDWQIETYDKIASAYQDRLAEHQQRVETLRAQAEADADVEMTFGSPPSVNEKVVRSELKKHCLSAIRRERFDEFDATQDGDPPFFDFVEAADEGKTIRFFEHAFEWDQMQYVMYPYFWARKSTWQQRFSQEHPDRRFLDFLRAGSARVSVPVRPGFEVAVSHYLETGEIWSGDSEPPEIGDPLYLAIVEEIRERTGASKGEVPVGESWETRIPTSLVLLRRADGLPEWEAVDKPKWQWRPKPESA